MYALPVKGLYAGLNMDRYQHPGTNNMECADVSGLSASSIWFTTLLTDMIFHLHKERRQRRQSYETIRPIWVILHA